MQKLRAQPNDSIMKVRDMTMETKGIEIKNKGILIFGIILFLIGLVASFYPEYYSETTIIKGYPYQNIGIVLVLAGIIFVAIGFLYSPRTSETKEKERVSVPAPPEHL